MPWYVSKDGQKYIVPTVQPSYSLDDIEFAKKRRRETGQLREELLTYQEFCGKNKDYDGARYFKEIANELLKEYRGWDGAIIWIETSKSDNISEQIAPYVDNAFDVILYRDIFE